MSDGQGIVVQIFSDKGYLGDLYVPNSCSVSEVIDYCCRFYGSNRVGFLRSDYPIALMFSGDKIEDFGLLNGSKLFLGEIYRDG